MHFQLYNTPEDVAAINIWGSRAELLAVISYRVGLGTANLSHYSYFIHALNNYVLFDGGFCYK